MDTLSRSKLMAFRQCPKRLWLQIHRPELVEDADATPARFLAGHRVGEVARRLYDPTGEGVTLDARTDGHEAALARTRSLLAERRPIFGGGFRAEGAQAFADMLLPVKARGRRAWRMVEVKSSASIKDHYREDVSIQAVVARAAGVPLAGVAVAYVNSQWTYPGDGEYQGLLVEQDLTEETCARADEVKQWITDAQAVVRKKAEPSVRMGMHCEKPPCPFASYCQGQEPQVEQPLAWLPRVQTHALKAYIDAHPAGELRDVPDALLNARQRRVKTATVSGRPFFDAQGAARALRDHTLPAYFMDFETVQFAVPIWKGTRPHQQIPFQFSVHRIGARGALAQEQFLDLSGEDPSKRFATALIAACGNRGPVFVYSAAFEKTRLAELARRFPRLAQPLAAISSRVVDLAPIARDHYYHPDQKGHWSIKDVLPAACGLRYDDLDGIQDGGMAMEAFREALAPQTAVDRKAEIERQLTTYCGLDTYGMVRLWELFAGRSLKL